MGRIITGLPRPSYQQGFSHSADVAAYPELWQGLVAGYSPELGPTGGTLFDHAGRRLNGSGSASEVSTSRGWARHTTTGNSLSIPSFPALEVTSVTVSAWVYIVSLNTGTDALGEAAIFDKSIGGSTNQSYLLFVDAGKLTFRAVISDDINSADPTDPANVPIGQWFHVAGSYNEFSGAARLYRDGNVVASEDRAPAPIDTGSGTALIGALHGLTTRFSGSLYLPELLVHNRALSASEIQLLAQGASPFQLAPRRVRGVGFAGGGGDLTLEISDSISFSDDRVFDFGLSSSDTFSLEDANALNFGKVLSDGVSISDAMALNAGKVLSDSVALSDSKALELSKAIQDSIALSDSAQAILTLVLALSDSLSLSDSHSKSLAKALIDTLGISDVLAKAFGQSIEDTISLSDLLDVLGGAANESNGGPTTLQFREAGNFFQMTDYGNWVNTINASA